MSDPDESTCQGRRLLSRAPSDRKREGRFELEVRLRNGVSFFDGDGPEGHLLKLSIVA